VFLLLSRVRFVGDGTLEGTLFVRIFPAIFLRSLTRTSWVLHEVTKTLYFKGGGRRWGIIVSVKL
jgi:hypothetical protein